MKNIVTFLFLLCFCSVGKGWGKNYTLFSPDKRLKIEISADEAGLYYSIYHKDSLILNRNRIGLGNQPGLVDHVKVVSNRVKRLEQQVQSPFYRFKSFRAVCNEMDLKLKGDFGVQFRAYDEGIAYRFYSKARKELVITDELAEFNFAGDYTAYLPYTTNEQKPMAMAFQNTYDVKPLSEARRQLAFLPVTVDCGNVKVTLLESDLEAYPGMFVTPSGAHGLKVCLLLIRRRWNFIRTGNSRMWPRQKTILPRCRENVLIRGVYWPLRKTIRRCRSITWCMPWLLLTVSVIAAG